MPLDTDMVRRVAALARIRLDDAETAHMQAELNGILGWIEQLAEVDVTGVEPMAGGSPAGDPALRWRPDVVTDGGIAHAVLANAPDRAGDYFAVPKVVE